MTVLLVMILLEGALRAYDALRNPKTNNSASANLPPLHIVCGDCPALYELNPNHPEINSQGHRDIEYEIPKPRNSLRIMVLGDSVAFGKAVPSDKTFPDLLESRLSQRGANVEVINAGVSGYTPYNELQYYLDKGSAFQPNIVMVAFAMNDIVDPHLHWNYTKDDIKTIPRGAVPNWRYHEEHVAPILQARAKERTIAGNKRKSPFRKSRLYGFIQPRLQGIFSSSAAQEGSDTESCFENGVCWPTYVTLEDTISIKVLLDYASPEWQWLRSMYGQLNDAVTRDGAKFVILMVPLAYQLEEDYPYLPQALLQRYCQENSNPCLDLLPRFREHADEMLFLGGRKRYKDIWHFSERGHQIAAEEIETFLIEGFPSLLNWTPDEQNLGELEIRTSLPGPVAPGPNRSYADE